ncbi:hypothetical protein ONS96_012005 [Cadophora gregata f. sp. sojae]|nr:hypothetical protein ONS96_012005 [Cadophora gregata f. sp. sojae]
MHRDWHRVSDAISDGHFRTLKCRLWSLPLLASTVQDAMKGLVNVGYQETAITQSVLLLYRARFGRSPGKGQQWTLKGPNQQHHSGPDKGALGEPELQQLQVSGRLGSSVPYDSVAYHPH